MSAFSSNIAIAPPPEILEESLKKICSRVLTDIQKKILLYIMENEHLELTISSYVKEVSKTLKIPESTAKWNLRLLRDLLLIEGGAIYRKGVPVRLTYSGLIVVEEIRREIK
ncbi:MAG: hypothetical protein NZ922_04255 [Candidatus Methanomethyliaceae archaeon]|nr:hypothetical protein [Candidatus Methanomethyliaceae archaeon]MDW7971070.1 hypothetical protein [Nitrososphaerota archaeon]